MRKVPFFREFRLLKNYKKFRDQDFNIFSVSLDKSREDWMQAIEKDSMIWNNVSNLKGMDGRVAMTYNINKVPTNYLINPEGKIIAVDLRGKKLDQKLEEIFTNSSK